MTDLPKDDLISVQNDDFDIVHEYQMMRDENQQDGAIVFFSGLVRDFNQGNEVTGLFLEHYPGMTEKSLEEICNDAKARWPLGKVRVIHRVGALNLGDQIVFVGVSSAHRKAAFDACEFIMDFLKTRAPFWKKEKLVDDERWIEARDSDDEAANRW